MFPINWDVFSADSIGGRGREYHERTMVAPLRFRLLRCYLVLGSMG